MNTRLQELISQAGTDCSGKWMGQHHAEKLAELIVRECIAICDSGTDTQTTCSGAARLIAQRFGIK